MLTALLGTQVGRKHVSQKTLVQDVTCDWHSVCHTAACALHSAGTHTKRHDRYIQSTTERALPPALAGSMEINRSKKQEVATPHPPFFHIYAKIGHIATTPSTVRLQARRGIRTSTVVAS